MSSFIFFTSVSASALIVYLWLYTDFLPFYLKLLKPLFTVKMYSWLMVDDFFNFYDERLVFNSYIEYLAFQKQDVSNFKIQFILKLLSCKTCLTTWVSILISLYFGSILWVGLIFLSININIFLLNFFLKTSR
jgi:hypothetical protein